MLRLLRERMSRTIVERYGYARGEFLGGTTIKDIRPPEEVWAAARRHHQPRRRRSREAKEVAPSAPRRLGDRRRGHHRGLHFQGPPRRSWRTTSPSASGSSAADGRAEDGGGRPARRRRRARLQQPADRDLRLRRDRCSPGDAGDASRARTHRARQPRRARRGADAAAARVQPARRCSQPAVLDLNELVAGHGADAATACIGEDIERRDAARRPTSGRSRPTAARSSRCC